MEKVCDCKEIECQGVDWIHVAHDVFQWWASVKFWILYMAWNFLTSCGC